MTSQNVSFDHSQLGNHVSIGAILCRPAGKSNEAATAAAQAKAEQAIAQAAKLEGKLEAMRG